jgi:hypothetical protein
MGDGGDDRFNGGVGSPPLDEPFGINDIHNDNMFDFLACWSLFTMNYHVLPYTGLGMRLILIRHCLSFPLPAGFHPLSPWNFRYTTHDMGIIAEWSFRTRRGQSRGCLT